MSSSLISSSSSSPTVAPADHPFRDLLDLRCRVSVVLGTGSVTVRQCLGLRRHSILGLDQSAGGDLQIRVNGITIARGEVVIVEDSTAIRVTEIPLPSSTER